MMKAILAFYDRSLEALKKGASIDDVVAMPSRERIGRLKYTAEDNVTQEFEDILHALDSDLDQAVNASAE